MISESILSEKLEDQQAAAEWGRKQAELIRKSDEITREMNDKYRPIILAQIERENGMSPRM